MKLVYSVFRAYHFDSKIILILHCEFENEWLIYPEYYKRRL